ncbi:uncharacterized protein prr12b isoform X6 [Pelmatolapia mariae]|uniref:uncharacterized protein prr12b isoform X6 n=1 Tax=Pelmatolapia mariae TaxID=158779 RepID=UPI002FE52CB6
MERNYPASGFGDLGTGTGWSYERSAKASLVYGSRSYHPESELLHRQTYGTPHPLQGYAASHHPGSSRQGGAWGGRTLGLSGLFDSSLHHASPSGPDPSVMNLISALDSRPPQPSPSASSLLSQFRTSSWQTGFPDNRQARNQLYHSTPPNTKTEATNMLGAEESQDEGNSEDFLIHHLLHPQSSNSHSSQHHPHSEQLSQPILHGESKGMTCDLNKISEERYQLQSVIRTNNITSNSGLGMAINDTVSSDRPLEISQKKQQARSDSIISKSNASGVRRISDSHSHAIHSHHQQNEVMGSGVHYGRGDPYIQHPNSQHPHSTSHVSTRSQHYTQHSQISQHSLHTQHIHHSQHSQHSHCNSLPQSHSHIEIKKPSDANDNAYYAPDVQQTRQSHVSVSLMNTSPDHPKQTHMLQSVPSHTIQNKLDSQQAPQQQHQQAMMGSVRRAGSAGLESHVQNRSSQSLDTHYSGPHPTYQTRASQSSVSPLQMLDQSLSQANGTDSGTSLDRSGADMTVTGQERDRGDRHTQQHRLNTHQHPQQTKSDLHDFLSEQDLDLYTPSHLSHLNQPQTHPHTHALQHTQHTHHQLSVTTQITHSHLQQMTIHLATPQQQQSQSTDPETQLSHSQLEQLKQHQFETVSQTDKVGQTQAQLQQCAPLTSICFPDCVFPEMEDLFCSSEYKSSCAGAGHSAEENLSQGHGPIQEDMEALKSGGAAEGYNMVGHQSNQGFGQYCQRLSRTGNGDLHLDHDCLKTHELPSTVNTDQLGLIQSQTPIMGLNSAVQGDSLVNKMIATVGVDENSNSTGVTSPIFCSSRPKKLLRTSSFHLLKQRREPQPQTKKNYAQEYEFGDDEDKADVPADIRLNNRRLPDLLPDLVSSCRKPGGVSGISGLSPQIGDMDFCHSSSYSSLGHPSQHPPHDGPKKRGRKPTKPKREGPPRPRGRPRIRPLPEPPYCRGLMGSVAGENRRGRGRGRGRGRREEGKVQMHRDMNKTQTLSYNHQQQYQQQQCSQQQHHQHHQQQHHRQQADLHQVPHQQLQQHHHHHQQEHVSCPHPQLHHQQQQHTSHQPQQDPVRTFKIKLPLATMSPPESLLRTDSLSSSEPVLSEGSVGSAPSLGLSPGPTTTVDYNRNEVNQTKDEMMIHQQRAKELVVDGWKKEIDSSLNPEAWTAMQKLSNSIDEKVFDFKPSFMASFLDFLKTGKKQPDLEPRYDGGNQETCSSVRGGIKCLSSSSPPLPPTSPQQPPGQFSDGSQGKGPDLTLSSCQSPCKPLDDELKRNLETLPSFSSDEEDSVNKNQDLQKSISSAISALYDTPHSLAAAVASAVVKAQPMLSPPTPQEPSLSPPLKTNSPLIPSMESIKDGAFTHTQHNTQNKQNTREEQKMISTLSDMEGVGSEHEREEENSKKEEGEEIASKEENMRHSHSMLQGAAEKQEKEDTASDMQIMEGHDDLPSGRVPAPAPPSPFISSSPLTYSSPSPLPPPSISVPSPPPVQQNEEEVSLNDLSSDQHMQQSSYQQAPTAATSPPPSTSPPVIPSSPLSNLPFGQSIPPPSTTPPPSSSDQDQEPEAGLPYFSTLSSSPSSLSSHPPSPPTPEEAPQSQRLTSLHLAKKQADAAIAGESEEEDSESGGEGIFRERDEFVVRTEDIGTLKMALQTGREPPPIWRVQKALLQKFSPEIKDGQRQFCATSNYLGYFGDAKVHYQRLYVKFLENVNKKDYVRVCSRKPWHRAGLTLRRQPLAKQLLTIHNQSQPRIDSRHKERRNERELMEQRERERRERETRKKVEMEHKERKRKEERDRKEQQKEETHEKEKDGGEQIEKGHRDVKMEWKKESESERREKEKKERKLKERQQRKKEKQDREQSERMKQEREWKEKERSLREQKERERIEKEKQEREREQKLRERQEREWGERDREQRDREQRDREQKDREQKDREQRDREQKDREQRDREQKDREQRDREQKDREQKDRDQKDREQRDREQKDREQRDREQKDREQKDREQRDREQKDREQRDREQKDREQRDREQRDRDQKDREQRDRDQKDREQRDRDQKDREQKDREQRDREQRDRDQKDREQRDRDQKDREQRDRDQKDREQRDREQRDREQRDRDQKDREQRDRDQKDREQRDREQRDRDQKDREQRDREQKDREQKDREQRDREQKDRDQRDREQKDREQKDREQRDREQRDREQKDREQRDREQKDREQRDRDQKDREQRDRDQKDREQRDREQKDREQRDREQRDREQRDRDQKDREQRDREQRDRDQKDREQKDRDQRDREQRDRDQKDREQRDMETDSEQKEKEKAQEKEKKENMEQVKRDYTMALKEEKNRGDIKMAFQGRAKTSKEKAEPPPKKRKKWLKAVLSSSSESDYSLLSDDEGPARGGVNSRAMRDMFRSYVEMLVSTALDPDMIQALEDTDDELYLPPMRKIDSMLSEQKKKLLRRVNMSAQHQEALHIFPKMTADPVESGVVKVHLGGEGYNRKTLNRVKRSIPKQQDMKLSIDICRIYSLYHSLHHYKYHTFLHCKKETDNIEQAAEDPGQEEVVQQCMANQGWLESLFSSFMELLTLSAQT